MRVANDKAPNAPPMTHIRLSPPLLDGDEQRLVAAAMAANQLTQGGPQVEAFEREMGAYAAAQGVAFDSGTAALQLALRLMGVGPGSTVWLPSFTCPTSVDPIRLLSATPAFIDCDATSWTMDPTLLAEALDEAASRGQLPAAVIVAHVYGQCANLAPILAACGRHGVPVIEDASHAVGSFYEGRHAGTLGRMGVLAFDDDTILTAGGGGMLLTTDAAIAGQARRLVMSGSDPGRLVMSGSDLGINQQLSDILAAIGRGQLARIEAKLTARRRIADGYRTVLSGLRGLTIRQEVTYGHAGTHANHWLTCVLIDPALAGTDRDQVRAALAAADIEACPVWMPFHLQPAFAGSRFIGGGVCADLAARGLCLPSGSGLSDAELERVASVVRTCWR